MIKKLILNLVFFFTSFLGFSQINNVIGIEGGGGINYPGPFYNKFESSIVYIFDAKYISTKLQLGIIPNTAFGNVYKGAFFLGFTTNPRKLVSFHFYNGIIYHNPDNSYYTNNEGQGSDYYFNVELAPILNSGLMINPFSNKKFTFSLDIYASQVSMQQGYKSIYLMDFPFCFNGGLNFLLYRDNSGRIQTQ